MTNATYINVIEPPNTVGLDATSINDSNQIVGGYSFVDPVTGVKTINAFIEQNGVITTTFQVPSSFLPGTSIHDTIAYGINNNGQVVGLYSENIRSPSNQITPQHGFLYDIRTETFSKIDVPGAFDTGPAKINDLGVVVGSYDDGPGTTSHGFLRDLQFNFHTIDVPGAADTWVSSINDHGDIVGYYDNVSGGKEYGFEKIGDTYVTINSPYGGNTALYDINNFGEIVGASSNGSGNAHGFIDNNGAFTMVDPPNSTRSNANGLNDFGDVVGLYTTKENPHGFGFLLA